MAVSNVSIVLDVHSPKKDAVIGIGAPTVGANDVAIWLGASVSPGLKQSAVGTFDILHSYMQTNIKDGVAVYSLEVGASDPQISEIAPLATEVGLYIGATVSAKQQSHFLSRTYARIIELLLEGAKDL